MKMLLGNSSVPNYIKITATLLLAVTYLGALGLAVDAYISYGPNATLPVIVPLIVGTGIGQAFNVLGLHQGASLAESGPPVPTTTTTVTTPPSASTTTVTATMKTGGTDASN